MNKKTIIYLVLSLTIIAALSLAFYKIYSDLQKNRCQLLTEKAINLMNEGDVPLAQLLLLEALPAKLPTTEAALRQSLLKNTLVLQESQNAEILETSSNGAHILGHMGYPDFQMLVWNSDNGELTLKIPVSESALACFCSNDSLFVVDDGLTIYDLRQRRAVRRMKSPIFRNNYNIYSDPYGRFLVLRSCKDGILYALDIQKGSFFKLWSDENMYANGKFINDSVFAFDYGNLFWVADLKNRHISRTTLDTNEYVYDYNEKLMLSYDFRTRISRLYRIGSNQPILTFDDRVYNKSISQLSPSGRYYATADSLGYIVLYDLQSGEMCRRISRRNANTVLSLDFDGRDDHLNCFTDETYEFIWIGEYSTVHTLPYDPHYATMCKNHAIAMVYCVYGRSAHNYFYGIYDGECQLSTCSVIESVEGDYLLYGREGDNAIVLKRLNENYYVPAKVHKIANYDSEWPYCFARFTSHNHMIFVMNGNEYYDLDGDTMTANSSFSGEYVGYTTNPDLLLTANDDCFNIWDPHKGKLLKKLKVPKKIAKYDLFDFHLFYSNNQWFLKYSYNYDGDHEVLANQVTCTFDADDMTIKYISEKDHTGYDVEHSDPKTSDNGKWRAANIDGNVLQIDDARSNELLRKISVAPYSYDGFKEFDFSPVADMVCVLNFRIKVYDIATGSLVRIYNPDELDYNITALAFSCDGRSIYFVNDYFDGTLYRVEFESLNQVRHRVEKSLAGRKLTKRERKVYNL